MQKSSVEPFNVCIVGVGLIGGSLGMALRHVRKNGKRRYWVTGLGRSGSKLRLAKNRGAVDSFFTNPKQALPLADIVVVCLPVHLISDWVKKNASSFKAGAVITDVGSVKEAIINKLKPFFKKKKNLSFVGGHPIAGSEKTGVQFARVDLFRNATCVLTKDNAPFSSLEKVHMLWSSVGAKCLLTTASDHDTWLALTSHLPHLLSFALFSQVNQAAVKAPVLRSLVAGSFRDMTRIAGADADLWTGVLMTNREKLKKAVKIFLNNLNLLARADRKQLHQSLSRLAQEKSHWK